MRLVPGAPHSVGTPASSQANHSQASTKATSHARLGGFLRLQPSTALTVGWVSVILP